ncbi:glycoside hydrolase domain-containing protein [uncultured Clostridium sp.]|uniref:glycoside hydrolase domain-containing protein n=1 Tax=uncultured Clostridium sp. TaxID=59620 RepID=UPI0028E70B66|nr:glycoside hydrolase domain-containing protein [uncultured Clostridium sp.]
MDQMVLKVQTWLNTTYGGNSNYTKVDEDGITGGTTVAALITALQIEIGISSPDGVFGPATMAACPTLPSSSATKNEVYILQGALYCKGYNPNGLDGGYGNGVMTAIKKFQSDAGLTTQDGITTPMIFKALLNTDAYVLISSGDSKIRTIEQNLNRDYNSTIGLIPCDGVYSRSTNTALIKALQHEQGNSPDGIWGPTTQAACPTIPGSSATTKFILLLQYALYCNGFDPNGFDGLFGNGLKTAITNFQQFVKLEADGYAGKQTWASLLVSTGDPNRTCTVCDCSTTITNEIAATLKSNGYQTVGRYLTGKFAMTAEELEIIFSNGLKVFPIFEYGSSKNYFTEQQAIKDADAANIAARNLGFNNSTIIYFAVDYDALDSDVTDTIIPYFKAINSEFIRNSKYAIGIYGARNVCSRVMAEGYAEACFVSDMSSGFSGNLGYKLPTDWCFDQISTVTIGSGSGQIEIDKDASSGIDIGVSSVTPPTMSIIDAANSTGLAALLGVSFEAAGEPITLVDTANVKIELEFSLGASAGSDENVIKFKNGEFEDATAQTALEAISAGLGADGALELTETLAKLNDDTEISIGASFTGDNSIEISLSTESEVVINEETSEKISISETLTIKLSFNLDAVLQEAKNTANSLVTQFEQNPVLGVIIAIAVVGVIIIGACSGSVAAVVAALLDGIAEAVIFIIDLLIELLPEVL